MLTKMDSRIAIMNQCAKCKIGGGGVLITDSETWKCKWWVRHLYQHQAWKNNGNYAD